MERIGTGVLRRSQHPMEVFGKALSQDEIVIHNDLSEELPQFVQVSLRRFEFLLIVQEFWLKFSNHDTAGIGYGFFVDYTRFLDVGKLFQLLYRAKKGFPYASSFHQPMEVRDPILLFTREAV